MLVSMDRSIEFDGIILVTVMYAFELGVTYVCNVLKLRDMYVSEQPTPWHCRVKTESVFTDAEKAPR